MPGGTPVGPPGKGGGRVWCAWNDEGAAYVRARSHERAAAAFKATFPGCEPEAPHSVELTEEDIRWRSFDGRVPSKRSIYRRMRAICPSGFSFGNDEFLGDANLSVEELYSFIRRQIGRAYRLATKSTCGGCERCDRCKRRDAIDSHLAAVLSCLKIGDG
jgi:hypothetical protein